MKNLIPKLTCVVCLTACSLSNAQSSDEGKNEPIEEVTIPSGLLVCKLTGKEFKDRLDELRNVVFARVESYREVEDGYVFQFKDEDDFLPKLTDYMLSERKCCPFFSFDLSIKGNDTRVALKVSGPEGAKEMIAMMIDE